MTITNTSHGRGLGSGGSSESSSGGNHGGGGGGGESTVEMDSSCLRVLVVDDDPTCLMILERMLTTCLYEVTKCNRAEIALSMLRKNKHGFDIVISDVHMPGMDGFKLLELISLEMDLPVIMMSADDSKSVVLKGVKHGAVDYLIKPVRMEALKTIWQHVVRKKKETIPTRGRGWDDDDDDDNSCLVNEGNNWNRKKRRFVWDDELHQKFLAAVNQLGGFEKAVPKKIFELMNVPGLTRKHVASHLQKCRTYLRRLGGVSQSQHQGNIDNSFVMGQDASFDPLSALNEFDLQELAGSPGQLPAQSFSQLQDAGLGLPTMVSESDFPVSSIADERSIFSFDNPTARFGDGYHGQQPQQRMMMMPLPDQEPFPQGSPPMQPMLSNAIPEKSFYSGRNIIPESGRVFPTCYTNAEPQNTSDSMYFNNFARELPVNSFPLASTPGQKADSAYQEDVNCSEAGFTPRSFDMFSNTHNDWDLQSLGIAFDAHQDAETVPCTSSGAYPSSAVAATEHDQSQQQTQQMPPRMVPHLDGSSVGAKPERGGIVDAVVNAFQEQSSDQKDILRKFGL
ncbi:unnamed protein product [Cochlearia groenlandica]